ncbi:MAG TPA: hypothetical protein VGJ50_19980, partial [Streptosporangiaceae bacterium]
MANITVFADNGDVQDERDRLSLGVVAGQGGDPRPAGLGPRCPRRPAAVPGPGVRAGEQGVGAVDLVAGGAEVLPDRAEVGAAGDAVLHQPDGLRLVREVTGACVDAQLGLQRVADGSGADEADQAPGGEVVDGAVLGVGGGDAVVDEPFVEGQVGEWAVPAQPVGAFWCRP